MKQKADFAHIRQQCGSRTDATVMTASCARRRAHSRCGLPDSLKGSGSLACANGKVTENKPAV